MQIPVGKKKKSTLPLSNSICGVQQVGSEIPVDPVDQFPCRPHYWCNPLAYFKASKAVSPQYLRPSESISTAPAAFPFANQWLPISMPL